MELKRIVGNILKTIKMCYEQKLYLANEMPQHALKMPNFFSIVGGMANGNNYMYHVHGEGYYFSQ
jgi:hypothetical protein